MTAMFFPRNVFLVLCAALFVAAATKRETFTITWKEGSPNGAVRNVIYTNGQFPSPSLVFDEGDDVEITVHNKMPFNTTIHWHGLLMQGTPWSDGVPGLGQKPIDPGDSYVYRFKAEPAGTYWYHSHSRATLMDGLYGALFIRPKAKTQGPWSLISRNKRDIRSMRAAAKNPTLSVVSDWSAFTSWEYMAAMEASGLDIFCVDSILLNGKGSTYCPGQSFLESKVSPYMNYALGGVPVNDKGCLPFVPSTEGDFLPGVPSAIPPHLWEGCVPSNGSEEVVTVDQSKGWVSINVVMASTMKAIVFSIDEHDLWLYEVDGQYIVPEKLQMITMFPAKRYAVMVKLDKPPGDYPIRLPDNGISQIITGGGIMRYKHGKPLPPTTPFVDYGGQNTSASVTDLAINGGIPWHAPAVSKKSDSMFIFYLSRWDSAWSWTFTGKAVMPVDEAADTPMLYYPNSPAALNPNLTIRTNYLDWVDLVIQVGASPREPIEISHVIHKHTSKAYLVGEGPGIWNYTDTAAAVAAQPQHFNFVNPALQDVYLTSFAGPTWMVLRYQVTNPGPWLLHCHSEIHLAGGMGTVIMDGVDKWPKIPREYQIDKKGGCD